MTRWFDFSAQLKLSREYRGLTLEDVFEISSWMNELYDYEVIPVQTLLEIESGNAEITHKQLKTLSYIYGVPYGYYYFPIEKFRNILPTIRLDILQDGAVFMLIDDENRLVMTRSQVQKLVKYLKINIIDDDELKEAEGGGMMRW